MEEEARLIAAVEKVLLNEGLAQRQDRFVMLFGFPIRSQGPTNMIKLHQIE